MAGNGARSQARHALELQHARRNEITTSLISPPRAAADPGWPLPCAHVHARAREKSLKNFGPVPTVSSLTLRRYAAGHADGAAGLVGAALTSVTALSISEQRLA